MPNSVDRTFNYDQLNNDTAVFVQNQTSEIRSLIKRTGQDIIEIGRRLIEVKEKLQHGQFKQWLEAEFAWDERTARRFMSVPRAFKTDKLSDLNIAPSALYILAAPSTPQQVKDEVLALAQDGTNITHKVAKEIKEKYTKGRAVDKTKVSPKDNDDVSNTSSANSPETVISKEDIQISSSNRQTVLKVIPKQEANEIMPLKRPQKINPPSVEDSRVNESEMWWKMGTKHLLYFGHFSSSQFLDYLPENVALSLYFPLSQELNLNFPINAKSTLVLHSIYQNVDPKTWRSLFINILELYTESEEIVVFSFLPDPELIFLSDKLGCRCIIAEPRRDKCQDMLSLWQERGGSVANMR